MSPIFKSDTARAIAKEVGLGDLSRNSKTTKKRSLTISGSNPAVTEALNNHQAKVRKLLKAHAWSICPDKIILSRQKFFPMPKKYIFACEIDGK